MKKTCERLTGHKSQQSSHPREFTKLTDLGNVLTSLYLPEAEAEKGIYIDHHKLSRFVWVFNGKCIAEKGYIARYMYIYMYVVYYRRLTLIFMTCKYLWLTRPCQFLARSLFSISTSAPSSYSSSSSASSCILPHTIFYDSLEIPKTICSLRKNAAKFYDTHNFSKWFSCFPPPVPLAMSCFVPVLRFLRFAWNDGNKKIDFPNDIYPSVGKRDILRVAHYHARFYSPSLVWTHHFDRCEFSHCSSQKSCAIYLYRKNSHVGVR